LPFELILVDDGSRDGAFEEIRRLAQQHAFLRGFRLSRNFGHQAALTIGLQKSRGDVVAIIDDDLQDPPELLPEFFRRLEAGADVVYGTRRKRKEGVFRRLLYAAFYRVLGLLSTIRIPPDAGDFCAMNRRVVDAMLQFVEANPFLRGIRSWVGFNQVGLEYERAARLQGESGYSMRKYIGFAMAGILSFSYIPLRLAILLGLMTALACLIFACYVVFAWFSGAFNVPGYASLIVVIAFLGSMQLFCLGVIGEYLARINDNARKWPVAVIAESTGAEDRP